MAIKQPRYSAPEAVRPGEEIYHNSIRAQVEPVHWGQYVAIDLETGAWEIDADENRVRERLHSRLPDAEVYVTRVGFGYVHRFEAGRIRQGASLTA